MRYRLEGLDCVVCAAQIEEELQKMEGLEDVEVNFVTKSINLPEGKEEVASEVITQVEPKVKLRKIENKARGSITEKKGEEAQTKVLIISGLLMIFGLIFLPQLRRTPFSWAEYAVFLIAYTLVGWPVLYRAIRQVIRGEFFDENFLMTISTIGAIAIRQLPEAAGVMLFYAIGEYLQERAVNRSRQDVEALLAIQPEYANLISNGEITKVQPETVKVGQVIIVKPGERVPLDGEVIEGSSYLDTSVLTGESVPRRVVKGEDILAGMINGQGVLQIKVAKTYQDSSVARILELVEEAAERKAPTERFITTFSHYYTPVVVGIALLIAFLPPLVVPGASFSDWFYRALVLLVISCPCALVVSIPLGYFGGIGACSRKGILVKGANYLDILARLDTVVFDKTGTLTKGVFSVTEVVPRNGFTKEELLSLAAGAEEYSNHPIAKSIREAFGKKQLSQKPSEYQEIPAHGIVATVGGRRVIAGNDRLLHKEKIPHQDCDLDGTIVYLAVDHIYAGYLVISDQIKEEAKETIKQLRELGIKKTVMLTGDDEKVARQVAEELGLDHYYAQLLPEEKVKKIEELEKPFQAQPSRKLAFIGDGINDAPVITRAQIGIAIGGLGSDAAIEAADIVLMDGSLQKLVTAIKISRRTRSIVRQNIIMTLGIKFIFLVLGSLGVAGIWQAIFADVGVTLLAVFNGMRSLRFK
mgnify:CR=1 FL=1|jgi:Cd2+/Zn2+-exporting ATPase